MVEFETYQDSAGEYRWRHTSGNDIIADSSEGYRSEGGVQDAVARIRKDAPDADVLEFGTPHFEVYKDRAGEFRWRLIASNGRIIADGSEGYESKTGASRALENVQGATTKAAATPE